MATTVQQFTKQNPGYTGQPNVTNRTVAPSPYAKGVGGFLERMLPGIGATIGAVGGSLVAPGVGTAGGGAGGATIGQKIEDLLTHQHSSAGTYLGQAALGTLGGVGKGLSAARGGVNALRAGETAGTAANILRLGSKGAATVGTEETPGVLNQALTAYQANAGKTFAGKMALGADKLGQQAMLSQTGALSKGTAESALKNIGSLRDLGYSSFNKAAEHAPIITGPNGASTIARTRLITNPNLGGLDTSNFVQTAKDIIDKHVALPTSSEKKILSLVQKTADAHGFEGNVGQYGRLGVAHPSQIDAAVRDLQTAAYTNAANTPERKALVDIVNSLKGPLDNSLSQSPIGDNVKTEIMNALKTQGIDKPQVLDAIKNASTYRDLAQLESRFVTASKATEEGQVNSLRGGVPGLAPSGKPTLTGMINQAAGRGVEKVVSNGGNVASRLLGKNSNIPESIPQLAGQTARKVGFMQGLVRAPAALATPTSPDQSQTQDQNLTQDTSTPDLSTQPTDNQSGSPFNADSIQQAILMDIATTGGKNISALTGLYNTFASPTAIKNQQSTLSATDQTRHDNLNSALASLDSAEQTLVNAGGAKGAAVGQLAKIPLFGQYLNNSGVAYEKTKTDTASQLAKAVTGGSRVNQSVFEGFLNSLPDVTDTPTQAAAKLKNLRTQMQTQAQRFGFIDLTGANQ